MIRTKTSGLLSVCDNIHLPGAYLRQQCLDDTMHAKNLPLSKLSRVFLAQCDACHDWQQSR